MGPIQILFICSLVIHVRIFVFNCIDLFLSLKTLKEPLSLGSFIPIFSEPRESISTLIFLMQTLNVYKKFSFVYCLLLLFLMKALRGPFVRQERS